MLPKRIREQIKKGQEILEYFDEHRKLPFERKRIDITLSIRTINKLKQESKKTGKPISRIIEECVR